MNPSIALFLIISLANTNVVYCRTTFGNAPMVSGFYDVYIHNYQSGISCTNPGTFNPPLGCDNAIVTCWYIHQYGALSVNVNAGGSDMCYYGGLYSTGSYNFGIASQNGITTSAGTCGNGYQIQTA
eukprot:PhF_6_TR41196/c0_g1_i1/m.62342